MAASSLFALIDDIATLLDDVAVLTKVAAKKTAGVLGDDLALNAQQVSGVSAERELPVVWAVAKGSMLNKAILVPAALLISFVTPWAVIPLLMVGGAYLCFEGFEKIAHKYLHPSVEEVAHHSDLVEALSLPEVDLLAFEKDKVKGAIRTDFVLSAEIITITLGTVAATPLLNQLMVLTAVAIIMTVGVYGLVAGIVKLDDAGFHLIKALGSSAWSGFKRGLGAIILRAAPLLMRGLSIGGTVAMFMVGGGILTHGVGFLHHGIDSASAAVAHIPVMGSVFSVLTPVLLNTLAGVVAGALVLLLVKLSSRIYAKFQK